MRHLLLYVSAFLLFATCLAGCRTTRKAQKVVADTTAYVNKSAVEVSLITHTDSAKTVSAATVSANTTIEETITTETFDTAGMVTQRTIIERRVHHNATANHRDSTITGSTTTIADSAKVNTTIATESHHETTTQPADKSNRLRLRHWLIIVLALMAFIAYFQYKGRR